MEAAVMKINATELNGRKGYRLACEDLEVFVCPEDGMNIYGINYGDTKVIEINPERYNEKVLYGMPILYPTPNRIRDNQFVYGDKVFPAQIHGIVKRSDFQVLEAKADQQGAYITGALSFEEGSALYKDFPFISVLKIKITVSKDQITYDYEVINKDTKALPYGFAVHPFFQNPQGDVTIQTTAKKVMEMTEDKLPTGVCLNTHGTDFDLSEPKLVTDLSLDHVYTDLAEPAAVINYKDFAIDLKATEDFSHLVVYTPEGQAYFCIENQTSSTDTHNLYHQGFKEESGLIVVEPNEKHKGQVRIGFTKN